jgi:hypothetical protein
LSKISISVSIRNNSKLSVAIITLSKFVMKINENEASKSPDSANQPMKSHKNITSAMAFHLKSENDRGED